LSTKDIIIGDVTASVTGYVEYDATEKGGGLGTQHRNGYPDLAAWITHDPDNESFVFRKFDRLSARNLLNLQNELLALEEKIDKLDRIMSESQDPNVLLSMKQWEDCERRAKSSGPEHHKQELDKSLRGKIKEYRKSPLHTTASNHELNTTQTKPSLSRGMGENRVVFEL
jgi:hypothetical protein